MESTANTVLLVLDESGAKGYDKNTEQYQGELGVVAGFALLKSEVYGFNSKLSEIVESYAHAADRKLHITDLEPKEQKKLRQCLFELFSQKHIRWFYSAIYVQGFNNENRSQVKPLMVSQRSSVKLSSNETSESLHGELFASAFGKGVALARDRIGIDTPLRLEVLIDRVDKPVLEIFNARAQELLNVWQPDRTKVSGFDTEKKEVVKRTIEIGAASVHDSFGDFSEIKYEIKCDDNLLTFAADVLANSVYRHLKQLQDNTPGASLNCQAAIQSHPLQGLVYGNTSDTGQLNVDDTLYKYPN